MPHLNPAELHLVLDAVLSAAPEKEIRIVKAPPGSGKSDCTRQAVATLLSTGRVKRVLWATRDTTDDNSLGAEAEAEFNKLLGPAGQTAMRIAGQSVAQQKKIDLQKQFDWGSSSVKIISHAHLPILFGHNPRLGKLARADLLVIDEDPLDSLLCSSHADSKPGDLNLAALIKVRAPDPVTATLVRLLQAAQTGELSSSGELPMFRRKRRDALLDDGPFYQAFHQTLAEVLGPSVAAPDWEAFRVTLDGLFKVSNPNFPSQLIVRSFQQAADKFSAAGLSSRRFGLRWVREGPAKDHALRYDLCRPVKFSLPVLILDGYADSQQYQAMFPARTIKVQPLGTPKPLNIEYKEELHLDATSDWFGKEHLQVQQRKQLVEEIAALLQREQPRPDGTCRPLVILTSKVLTVKGRRWLTDVAATLNGIDPALVALVKSAHWFAGRGLNTYKDHHVVALTQPIRPAVHREHVMAALFAFDPAQRRAAHLHLERSELLQMLHRGRQPFHPGARIITGFKPDLPGHQATCIEYQANKIFTAGSKNTRSLDGIEVHAEELASLLGGVPRLALQCVGLVRNTQKTTETVDRARLTLVAQIQKSKKPLVHLRAWADGTARTYGDVAPSNSRHSHDRQQKEVFDKQNLRKFTVPKSGKLGQQIVHATTAKRAEKALRLLT